MYKKKLRFTARVNVNNSQEGESIERRMERLMNNDETEAVESKDLIYGRPDEDVNPNTDIRADHWADAHEKGSKLIEEQDAWKDNRKKMKIAKEEEAKKAEKGSEKTGSDGKEGNV